MPGRRGARRTARRTTRRTVHRTRRRTRRRVRRRRVMIGGAVLLFAGGTYAAIKLSQKDADRVEEYTGVPAEDLTEDDLEEAMRELNIKSMEITDDDQAIIERDGGQTASPPAAQAQTAAAGASGEEDYIAELEKLSDLANRGVITQEEFEAKKKQLLGL